MLCYSNDVRFIFYIFFFCLQCHCSDGTAHNNSCPGNLRHIGNSHRTSKNTKKDHHSNGTGYNNCRPGILRHIGNPHSTSKNTKKDVKSYVRMQLHLYLKKHPEVIKSARRYTWKYIFEKPAASAQ